MLRSVAVVLGVVLTAATLTGCLGDDPAPSGAAASSTTASAPDGGSSTTAGAGTSTTGAATGTSTGTTVTTLATSSTAPRVGSSVRPIAVGESFALNADWSLVVRRLVTDAPVAVPTTAALGQTTTTDPYGTSAPAPPVAVRVGVTVTYQGTYPQGNVSALRIGIVGSTAVPYRAITCPASVTDAIALGAPAAQGQPITGTFCFQVERADSGGLVLFARAGVTTRDTYFVLPPATSGTVAAPGVR